MAKDNKNTRVISRLGIALSVLIVASIFFTVNLFRESPSAARYAGAVARSVSGFFNLLTGSGDLNGVDMTICRILSVALAGAALSISGMAYQGIFQNPMAGPEALGAQSGGVLAGTVFIFMFGAGAETATTYTGAQLAEYYAGISFFARYAMQICIVSGAMVSVFAIAAIARTAGGGKISSVALLMTGTLFSSFISSCVGLLRYYIIMSDPTDPRISMLQLFMIGSFNNVFALRHLLWIGIPTLFGIGTLLCLSGRINGLVFGEDEAAAMGIRVNVFRNILIALVTVMIAVITAFCGPIGFVGLMTPHITRRIVGSDMTVALPASALIGAIVMVVMYDIAFTLNLAAYANLFAGLILGPLFGILLIKARRERNAWWA